jgi:hypothetical protein
VDQMREAAKLKRMMEGPAYCLQLFAAAVLGQPSRGFRWRRIPSARSYRMAAWPSSSLRPNLRRIPRSRPPQS